MLDRFADLTKFRVISTTFWSIPFNSINYIAIKSPVMVDLASLFLLVLHVHFETKPGRIYKSHLLPVNSGFLLVIFLGQDFSSRWLHRILVGEIDNFVDSVDSARPSRGCTLGLTRLELASRPGGICRGEI